ncbi:PREDICTED: disease resistance protein RPM1-like isoform X2 [Nelumbo nucifera]|uniref:Disease resistance protein RPM1-like isoform X2 n=1 Tax=Nelumbo nucifera TaxID=4432 RepID=A0A1U8AUZ1_NELNU|nr:PREDICTED: disease resistance protein RPM1-like isoform X2 [Nelumbo nucifera]
MAESAVNFLLDKLEDLIDEKLHHFGGVEKEIKYIRNELASMRVFLRGADAGEEMNQTVKDWVKQLIDLAHYIEDVLDEYMFQLAQQQQQQEEEEEEEEEEEKEQQRQHQLLVFLQGIVFSFFQKVTLSIKQLIGRHPIFPQILEIKATVDEISQRLQRFNFGRLDQGPNSNFASDTWYDLRGDSLLLEEADLVGIDKPKKEIIEFLVKGSPRLGVLLVVGMGGVGKTSLVKQAFDDRRVKVYFNIHIWISVSQSFKLDELLKDMMRQLCEESKEPVPQRLDGMKETELKLALKEFLKQKRYVIVLDDMWSKFDWDSIRHIFIDCNCKSRIIVTTRSDDIAASCNNYFVQTYRLQPLCEKESWTLFCKKTFWSVDENNCPPQLEKLSRSIVRKCGGLPLAIVTVGGVLSTKQRTLTEWEMFDRSLGGELQNDDRLRSVMKILSLSYNDLPYHLKSGFLCLSIFPEDESIETMRLIRIWMAEGFIQRRQGKTLEEVGESYLYELVNRSLIQVTETTYDGRIKTCRVHDLIRKIILLKAKDQNFGTIIDGDDDEQDIIMVGKITRRLSIHNSCQEVAPEQNFTHLRSLFMFRVDTLSNIYRNGAFFSSLKLLKVLDLRVAPLEEFPEEFTNFFHLRYLSLRKTMVKEIPNSIKKLQNLETLDLKQTYVSELPIGILDLHKLRHLLVYRYNFGPHVVFHHQGFKAPSGIGNLESLQKLCYIDVSTGSDLITTLGRLVQLRRLGIHKLKREDGVNLCSSMENMNCLQSLSISAIEEGEILDLQFLSSPPPFLRTLLLKGRLEKLPHWIPSLHNLCLMDLRWSKMKDDPLEALKCLPQLKRLNLMHAYDGEQLCFQSGGFQKLENLGLERLERLRMVTIEEAALPQLENLYISGCEMLENAPLGIEHLNELKMLLFLEMPNEFKGRLRPRDRLLE